MQVLAGGVVDRRPFICSGGMMSMIVTDMDGRQRPIGIASLEDKIVQQALVFVLQTIYEEDSEVPESRSVGGRRVVEDGGGDATRCGNFVTIAK